MEEDNEDKYTTSPFWLHTNNSFRLDRRRTNHQSSSSVFFNSTFLVLLLLSLALAFFFFIVQPFIAFMSQTLKSESVKKSRDSLYLIIILCAVFFGFLTRNNNDNDDMDTSREVQKSSPVTPRPDHWGNYVFDRYSDDRTVYRLKSCSSYPDLRQESLRRSDDGQRWRFHDDTHVYNYPNSSSDHVYQRYTPFEDQSGSSSRVVEVDKFVAESPPTSPPPPPPPPPRRKTRRTYQDFAPKETVEKTELDIRIPQPPPPPSKEVERKTRQTYQEMATEATRKRTDLDIRVSDPPSPSPPPPLKVAARKTNRTYKDKDLTHKGTRSKDRPTTPAKASSKRTYQNRSHTGTMEKSDLRIEASTSQSEVPQPTSPPPTPSPMYGISDNQYLTALRRAKKKRRQKSVEDLDTLFDSYYHATAFPSQPPPPPPPPPLFSSTKQKTKNLRSVPPPPPPPPPSPPLFWETLLPTIKPKAKKTHPVPPPPTPPPPPLPTPPPPPLFWKSLLPSKKPKKKKLDSVTPPPPPPPPQSRKSKSQTPNITTYEPKFSTNQTNTHDYTTLRNDSPYIPIPPPPPPPFKMRPWKFVVQGDFVRMASSISSYSGSTDEDDERDPENSALVGSEGGESSAPLFCQSPDVDTKAEKFITNFRAGLRLEKVNSVKERGKSILGPS